MVPIGENLISNIKFEESKRLINRFVEEKDEIRNAVSLTFMQECLETRLVRFIRDTPCAHAHLAGREVSLGDHHVPLSTPSRQKPSPHPWARCLNLMTRERAGNFATRVSLLMYTRVYVGIM